MNEKHQCIQLARGGDEVATLRLLELSQKDIRRYAERTCSTWADVEDATQESLWQLSRGIDSLRAVAAFSSWLFRIVQRECQKLWRAWGLSRQTEPAHLATMPDWELRLDLARGVASLPLLYRELVLRDFEELTIEEIGCRLKLEREAVKSRLRRARALLREYLQK